MPQTSKTGGTGGRKQPPKKPDTPRTGFRVEPDDPVEEASNESFPASDPPSFSPSRAGPPRPSGENPERKR